MQVKRNTVHSHLCLISKSLTILWFLCLQIGQNLDKSMNGVFNLYDGKNPETQAVNLLQSEVSVVVLCTSLDQFSHFYFHMHQQPLPSLSSLPPVRLHFLFLCFYVAVVSSRTMMVKKNSPQACSECATFTPVINNQCSKC